MCTKFGLRWSLDCDTRRGNGCFVSMLNTIAKHQPVDRCWLCTPLALAVPRCALPRRFWLAISWGGSHWRHGVSNWFVQFLVHILLTSKRAAPYPFQLFNCVLHAEIANWIALWTRAKTKRLIMQAEDGAGRCHTQLLSESKWMQRNIGSKWFKCHELAILNGPFSIERRSEMAHLMVQIRQGDRREVFQAAVSATTPHMLPLFTISEHVQMIKNLRDQFPSMQAKRRKEFIAKIALKRYQTTFQAMPVAVHVAVADDCLRKKVDWRFRNYCVQQELSGLTCHRCQRESSNSAFQSPKPQVFHSLQGTIRNQWIPMNLFHVIMPEAPDVRRSFCCNWKNGRAPRLMKFEPLVWSCERMTRAG